MRIVSPTSRAFILAFVVFLFSPSRPAQDASLPVSKVRALRLVRVSSLPGWREEVSNEGRFRVLFPCGPEISADVISVKELKCTYAGVSWQVSYTELPRAVLSDEFKQRYHQANRA